jgi:phosphoribosylformylglycinamidine cyclo-ligase
MSAYTNVGVDVEKADKFVDHIGVDKKDFAAVIKIGREDVVCATDGVGTKILLAEKLNKFDTIGIDLVAMCVNDLLCKGAEPVAFLDYYATGKLDLNKSKEILKGIKRGCEIAGCQLVGGETAELPGMYFGNRFDLAGFAIGALKRRSSFTATEGLPRSHMINEGHLLVGIPSSGPHSNGFSLLRKYMIPSLELLEPTRMYVREIMDNYWSIHAAAHITGGGLRHNIDRVVPERLKYKLDFEYNEFWQKVYRECDMTNEEEFESIFNCGWGMVIVIDEKSLCSIQQNIPDCQVLGVLEKR